MHQRINCSPSEFLFLGTLPNTRSENLASWKPAQLPAAGEGNRPRHEHTGARGTHSYKKVLFIWCFPSYVIVKVKRRDRFAKEISVKMLMEEFKNISVLDSNTKMGIFDSPGILPMGLQGNPRPPDHHPRLGSPQLLPTCQFCSDNHAQIPSSLEFSPS